MPALAVATRIEVARRSYARAFAAYAARPNTGTLTDLEIAGMTLHSALHTPITD